MDFRSTTLIVFLPPLLLLSFPLLGQEIVLKGRVTDPQGNALPKAAVQLMDRGQAAARALTGPDGSFRIEVSSTGQFVLKVDADGFSPVEQRIILAKGLPEINVRMSKVSSRLENVTVLASVDQPDIFSPDPAQKVFLRQDLLDANPGRPGAPVSIPGFPIESASGGIKAPQYFAPGVAGDHGEPIAQYIAVGDSLVPNNLSANAHGNGYSDPNIFITQALETVQVDGGAFNVREGNHSVNLAAAYGFGSSLDPFLTITGDYRDLDLVAGLSPSAASWLAFEASYGNGLLDRLEHRQQYKFNGERRFHSGNHTLALAGIGYYGSSFVPGLVPTLALNPADSNFPNYGDTIDPRQKDQTHTALVVFSDHWQVATTQQLELSSFFRTYNLSLFSDFGQGLIRQSEFRTVTGASVNYVSKIAEYLSLLVGFDYQREAPRRDDLDHYGFFNLSNPNYYGPSTPVDGNNITISSLAPYLAAEGALARHFRYYLGWRRDEIDVENDDLLHAQNSFQNWVGLNSPKATVAFLPNDSWYLPLVSLSFGQAFFTEDPRIGTGTDAGSLVATSHSYQIVASKRIRKTDVRLTLGHVTSSAQLAKIDPDTGLQFNQGPSRLRFMTVAARQSFSYGSLLATFSKADARDLDSGLPTPEAPRTIFDLLGTMQKLPLHIQAQAEFEYVGLKPLGTGCLPNLNSECTGTSVKEFRGAVVRSFRNERVTASVNFLIAGGYSGQTTENFYPSAIQEVVGVRIPSYASVSFTYRFGRAATP